MARKLGEFLIEEGLLTPSQLQLGIEAQRQRGGSLGTNLLALGLLDEDALARLLGRVYGVPSASRGELLAAAPEIVALLSADYARRHRALPFRVEGDHLALALQNPNDSLAVHEAAFLTGFVVVPYVAPEVVIRAALARHHHLPEITLGGSATPAPVQTGPIAPVEPRPELARRLADAGTRDAVVAIALDELALLLPRALAFAVRGGEALLVSSRGAEIPPARTVAVPAGEPSVLTPAIEGRIVYGPVKLGPGNQDLYTLLGGRTPASALVGPAQVRGRTALLLYADDPAGSLVRPDVDRFRRLLALTGSALEIALIRAKMLSP